MNKIFFFISLLCLCQLGNSFKSIDTVIAELSEKINTYQVLKPLNGTPPFTWYEKKGIKFIIKTPLSLNHFNVDCLYKGLFRSDIRLNFAGNPVLQTLRDGLASVFDNDMFSSGWIITALLEANLYGKGAPVFDAKRLDLALSAISEYNNKNDLNNKQSVVRTFWQQHLNETSGLWYQQPTNIRSVTLFLKDAFDFIPWKQIESLLKSLGLTKWEQIVEKIEHDGGEVPQDLLDVFCIPPDFDDTYLNLGMGATLSKLTQFYPDIYASWLRNNSNIDHLVDVTVKYAYEPFNEDINKNLIDPRTYFYVI